MKNAILIIMGFFVIFSLNPVFGTSYEMAIDEHVYNLEYMVDADVIAMAIDQELNSLLIGIDKTQDSLFEIELPNEMISAKNNEFAILVDGYEVEYQIIEGASSNTFTFFVPMNSQEIEIIGTHVIPEFPLGILVIFSVLITLSILISKKSLMQIRW